MAQVDGKKRYRHETLRVPSAVQSYKLFYTRQNSAELSDGAESVNAMLSDDAFTACQTADVGFGTLLRLTLFSSAAVDGKTCVSRHLASLGLCSQNRAVACLFVAAR